MIDMELKLHSNKTGFTVQMIDAKGVILDALADVNKHEAAREFQKRTKNVSAMTGVIQRVAILDHHDRIMIMWEHGKGYTYDGETYTDQPILETEVKSYAKAQRH